MTGLEEIQKLPKLPTLDRADSTNYIRVVHVTISISCHDCPIQPRVGIDCLELNQVGVILRQKIGSKI